MVVMARFIDFTALGAIYSCGASISISMSRLAAGIDICYSLVAGSQVFFSECVGLYQQVEGGLRPSLGDEHPAPIRDLASQAWEALPDARCCVKCTVQSLNLRLNSQSCRRSHNGLIAGIITDAVRTSTQISTQIIISYQI